MSKFFRKRSPKVDPAELDRQTDEVNRMLEREGTRMTFIADWLERRKGQNGFGEDFDITFYPREAK